MASSQLLSIVTFVYGLASFLYITAWIFNKPAVARLAVWTAIIGAAGNIAGIIMRWVESYQLGIGHAPLSNLYESLVFFAAALTVIHLVVEHQYKNRIIGAFATPLAFLTMAYASFGPNQSIQPLIPALKSNWLIAHVITCFFGYAGFAIAFGVSLMYLFKESGRDSKKGLRALLPQKTVLDQLTHQMITFGFLFLTIGIITGAVWANSAWGSYWSWDPKETWSLITWLIYATLLHARFARGWSGTRVAWLSIIGFMAVMFTYFGVNLLPGLHSYGAA
jgi:cytochrome c-type biogenesis protein CcsB